MITIEQLESIATELEQESAEQRARLARLCQAYTRILAAREPAAFTPRACVLADEAGHWDNSYPPKKVYTDHTGPQSIRITESDTEDIATSPGFYYEWRRVTTYGGLAIGSDGTWYRSEITGTGQVGQFAAHPGDCHVDVTIMWCAVDTGDLSTAELTEAERTLRTLAFPLVAARLGA